MTRKTPIVLGLACGLAAVGLVTVALGAGGGVKVQGALKLSDGGKIAMVVKSKQGGSPVKLENIKITKLPYICDDGSTGSVDSKAPGPAEVRYYGTGFEWTLAYNSGENTAYSLQGTVNKAGTKVSGGVNVAFLQETPTGSQGCNTYDLGIKAGHFTAKPKKK